MKFSQIAEKLSANATNNSLSLNPDCDPEITGIAAIEEANTGLLSYIEGSKFAPEVGKTAASALILPKNAAIQAEATNRGLAWIAGAEPRLLFAQAIAIFYKPFHPQPGIHPSAIIHTTAEIGTDVYIGNQVVIQAGVKIGNGAAIYPKVVIYPEVQIGDRTILHANSTIHERTRIGKDCVIHSGAVIGAEGFGFVPSRQGWYKMQQSGITLVGDGVEIGCRSTVDRPAVGETRIGSYSKLDNQVHIGHNGHVGSGSALAGQVGMAGGSTVGNYVLLGGQVGVANQTRVEDGTIATARTGIHSRVAPKSVVSGAVGIPHKLWLKASVVYARLPEIYQTLKKLQKRVK